MADRHQNRPERGTEKRSVVYVSNYICTELKKLI